MATRELKMATDMGGAQRSTTKNLVAADPEV